MRTKPGLLVLFGSGEISAEGQRIHDYVMRQLDGPVRACVLETPAGFELNSAQVAGRVADFLRVRLQNHRPQVTVVPARRRGTALSPDNPEVVEPVFDSNYIVMGPGSPTYAVRQLSGSLAWHAILARHRLGSPLILASAAVIAASAHALPIYEIYKVGEDPHWITGLDLFGQFGRSFALVPHWNNADGGQDLDTSRCFMGRERFEQLLRLLPPEAVVLGVDENTALVFDFDSERCLVKGLGGATVLRGSLEARYEAGAEVPFSALGSFRWPTPGEHIPRDVWERAVGVEPGPEVPGEPGPEVRALVAARASARAAGDWATADRLRLEIASLGWQVRDTASGPDLRQLPDKD